MTSTSRRTAIKQLTGTAALAMSGLSAAALPMETMPPLKGNLKHSLSHWTYQSIPLDELCQICKSIGIQSLELTGPDEWPVMAKYGLTSAMGWTKWPDGMGLDNFMNVPKNHDTLVSLYTTLLPQAASAGVKNVICFSGNRRGLDDYQGLLNCQKVLKRIMPIAEKNNVILSMELLSSRDSHPDYQCDDVKWGAVLCEMVGSPNFKLLYDIFHMQSMTGDHIRNIRRYGQYISHYHTGGHPGRHEIDETQEIYYPAIMRAIVETGYRGYVGQEFVPSGKDQVSRVEALRKAVLICDV